MIRGDADLFSSFLRIRMLEDLFSFFVEMKCLFNSAASLFENFDNDSKVGCVLPLF